MPEEWPGRQTFEFSHLCQNDSSVSVQAASGFCFSAAQLDPEVDNVHSFKKEQQGCATFERKIFSKNHITKLFTQSMFICPDVFNVLIQ